MRRTYNTKIKPLSPYFLSLSCMYHINDNLEYSVNVVSILDLIKISLDPFLFKRICRFFLGFRPNIQYV